MNDQIDREFEQPNPEAPPPRESSAVRGNRIFPWMLSLSILLHLALTPLIFLPGKRSGGLSVPSTIGVDLNTVPTIPRSLPPPEPPPEEPTQAKPEPPIIPQPTATAPATEAEELNTRIREAVSGGREQPELLEQASLGLGLSLGYFSSLAEGRTLRDDIKEYYFTLLRKVNEQWWLIGAGTVRTPRIPVLTVVLNRNGDLLNRVIEQGSGDPEFDRKILRSVDGAAPFPPLPPTYREQYFTVPIRMVPPLNLLLGGGEFKGHP